MSRWSEVIGLAVLAGALSALGAPAPGVKAAPASARGDFQKDAPKDGDGTVEATGEDKSAAAEAQPQARVPASKPPIATHTYAISASASAPPIAGAVVQSRDVEDGIIDIRKPMFATIDCPPKDADYDKYYVVCAQVSGDRVEAVSMFPDTGAVLLPNHSFRVIILHPRDRRIVVGTTGAYGVYSPGIRGDVGRKEDVARGVNEPVRWTVTEKIFPPFMPPKASLHIGVAMPDATQELDGADVDLFIQEAYAGAIRLGLGAVGVGARNEQYARVPDAAGTASIVRRLGPAQADFEMVLGYTPYLDAGGRGQLGCVRRPFCFAPYVGLGVVSPQAQAGFDFLTSFHLGVDWEITNAFSLTATLVARRVDRLAPGLTVGGTVADTAELTHKELGYGAALIFNVSPEFMKVAATGATGLLH